MFGQFLNIQSLFQNHKTEKLNWNSCFKNVISSLLGQQVLNFQKSRLKVQVDFTFATFNRQRKNCLMHMKTFHNRPFCTFKFRKAYKLYRTKLEIPKLEIQYWKFQYQKFQYCNLCNFIDSFYWIHFSVKSSSLSVSVFVQICCANYFFIFIIPSYIHFWGATILFFRIQNLSNC